MIDSFFIRENELESYSFKQVLEIKKINVEMFKKVFDNDSINFDLTIINFLQFLFNLPGVIGMFSNGQEIGHFQAFQLKLSTSPNKSNENINDDNDIYGVSSNNINIEEKEELNNNETKEEKKKKKKKNLQKILQLFSKLILLNNKKNQKKMLNKVYLKIIVLHITKKMVLIY
jgi:hypothetical protein